MPHLIIEYSANLERCLDLPALIDCLHTATAALDAFPLAGLRTRAARRDLYRIADGHPDNSFVHVVLRIGHGRALDIREAAGKAIFAALEAFLEPISAGRPLATSFEMVEIDPVLNFKSGNIRDHMARRAAAT